MSLFDIFPKKQAETPASIVTVDDAAGLPVAKMKMKLEPVQDLHGYDSPWPGGGGKNLLNVDTNTTGYSIGATGNIVQMENGNYTDLIPVTVGQQYTFSAKSGVSSNETRRMHGYDSNGTWVQQIDYKSGSIAVGTVYSFGGTIPSGVSFVRVSYIKIDTEAQLELGSTATSYDPYSNICPISGRTGLTVYRTGKNLFDPAYKTVQNANTIRFYQGNRISLPAGTYTMSGTQTFNGLYVNSDGGSIFTKYNSTFMTFTLTEETAVDFNFFKNDGNDPNDSFMLEVGSTATTYEPYSGSTYTSDWTTQAGTVYGGSLDVVTGVLTVTHKAYVFNGTENEWSASGTYQGSFYYNTDEEHNNSGICSHAQFVSATSSYAFGKFVLDGGSPARKNINVWVQSAGTTVAQFKTWLATEYSNGTPLTFVLELATPLTYQLTQQQIVLIKNAINNVWTDAGDILEFEYYTEADYGPISGAFIDGKSLQDAGWFLKWRKLSAPKPKVDYTSIYGKDGSIDQTEALGDVFYEDRDVNLDMVYNGDNWSEAYSDLLNAVHGQSCMVQFTDDPYWYWSARLAANVFTHKPRSLEMSGLAFPYKLSVIENVYSATVSGATEETATEFALEGSRMKVSPKVVVTGSITLKWGTNTKTLSAGTYYVRGLKVGLDGVTIKVWGTGTVTITYREGSL